MYIFIITLFIICLFCISKRRKKNTYTSSSESSVEFLSQADEMAPGLRRTRNTPRYQYYNANPRGYVREGDCVTRAFALAFNEPWEVILTEQWAFGLLNGRAMSCQHVVDMVANKHGYIRMKQPKKPDGTKYTPADFCALCDKIGCEDPIVLHLSRHLVTIKRCDEDGVYKVHDTWNSSWYGRVGYFYVSPKDREKFLV